MFPLATKRDGTRTGGELQMVLAIAYIHASFQERLSTTTHTAATVLLP